MNNGFLCVSPKVVVVPEGWKHKEKFLELFLAFLKEKPTFPGYYKGAHFRHETFLQNYKEDVVRVKPKNFQDDHLEWLVLPNLKPKENGRELAFTMESFSPFICFVELPGTKHSQTPSFLKKAASFCNEKLWGNLSCTLIIPDEDLSQYEKEVEETIESIKYGTVGLNIWAVMGFGRGTWGAYGGKGDAKDIQSGQHFVSNLFLIDNALKTVVRCPLVSRAHANEKLSPTKRLMVISAVAHYYITPTFYNLSKCFASLLSPFSYVNF